MLAMVLATTIELKNTIEVGLVNSDPNVAVGEYITGRIDISDLEAAGGGPIVSSAALLGHEISEQTVRQTVGVPDTDLGYLFSHLYASDIQSMISGYDRGATKNFFINANPRTGISFTGHERDGVTSVVTLVWNNGDLVKVIH